MERKRWLRIERLLHEARSREGSDRARFLDEATAGEPELRIEVDSLLREIEEDPGFLEVPVGHVEGTIDGSLQEADQRWIGGYRVIRPLGRGGMGQVLLALREEPRQYVAIKRVRRGLDTEDVLTRFRTERRILASLSHPNIATLLDVGIDDQGSPFIVMEYVDGSPIDVHCDTHRLSVEARLRLFQIVCSAVQHAHQSLVIHRDLKPGNIFVTGDGVPMLLDFGIGKILLSTEDGHLTRADGRFFTPDYAAPEVLKGQPATTATDIYQLGVLLYELLTGRRPHRTEDGNAEQLRRSILGSSPHRPSDVVEESSKVGEQGRGMTSEALADARKTDVKALRRMLRGDLDRIILKAMRMDPVQRYPSAYSLAEDLERYLDGRPVRARPASVGYRARKFVRRNRVGVAAALVVFLSLFSTTVVTLVQSNRVRDEATRVARERDKALQVKGFLLEMLGSTGPDLPAGETPTVRELLDLRAGTVAQEFGGKPELKAEFLDVLAEGYDRLGLFREAEGHAREALLIREGLFGTSGVNADLATSLNTLGWVRHERGFSREADSLLQRAVDMRRVLFPGGHEQLARSLNDLGVVKEALGDYEAAEALYREALALRVALQGENHRGVAVTLSNLSVVLYRRGRMDQAVAMAEQSLETFRTALGADHPRSLIVQSNLAAMMAASGDIQGAIRLNRDVLERRRKQRGPNHLEVGTSLGLLASYVEQSGNLREAESLIREQIRIQEAWFNEDHPDLATALSNLGSVQLKDGRYEEAAATLERALAMRRDRLALDDPTLAMTISNLAQALLRSGDTAAAFPNVRESARVFEGTLGPADPNTLLEKVLLAELHAFRGEPTIVDSILTEVRSDLGGQPLPAPLRERISRLEDPEGPGRGS